MKTYDINAVEEQLKTQNTAAYLTSGTSMRPLLRTHKDIVVISRVMYHLSVGDVALYRKKSSEKLILHRIIGIKDDDTYIIRGDNTYHKEYIPHCDVIGVMTAIYRGGRYIDCERSLSYKIYVKINRILYPLRWLWYAEIRVFLSHIKRKIFSWVGWS